MAARSRGLVFFGQRLLISSRGGSSSSSVVDLCCAGSQLGWKRYCSGPSWEDSADGEMDMSPSRRLEQALQEIRIQKAAPDWLPLFPGGSFWIHPDQIAKEPSKPSGPLLEPASEREVFAMVAPTGWPSSTAVDDVGKTTVIEVVDASASLYGPTSEEELLALLVPSGWPDLSSAAEALSPEPEAGY